MAKRKKRCPHCGLLEQGDAIWTPGMCICIDPAEDVELTEPLSDHDSPYQAMLKNAHCPTCPAPNDLSVIAGGGRQCAKCGQLWKWNSACNLFVKDYAPGFIGVKKIVQHMQEHSILAEHAEKHLGAERLCDVSVFTSRTGALELLQLGGCINDDWVTIGPLCRKGWLSRYIKIRPGYSQYFPENVSGSGPDYFIVRGCLLSFDLESAVEPPGGYDTFQAQALCADAVFDIKEFLWRSAT